MSTLRRCNRTILGWYRIKFCLSVPARESAGLFVFCLSFSKPPEVQMECTAGIHLSKYRQHGASSLQIRALLRQLLSRMELMLRPGCTVHTAFPLCRWNYRCPTFSIATAKTIRKQGPTALDSARLTAKERRMLSTNEHGL